jgi:hypothetical protein
MIFLTVYVYNTPAGLDALRVAKLKGEKVIYF